MSADQLLQGLTQATYVLLFMVVTIEAARSRRAAAVNIALFFGTVALIVVIGWATSILSYRQRR